MKERLFVDTNPFLYLLNKEESRWEKIRDILNNENYEFYTSVLVLNEVKFKSLWTAASEKLKNSNKFEIIKHIKKDKELREQVYSKFLPFYINLKNLAQILDLNAEDEIESCSLSQEYGLLPTDSSILATMLKNKVKLILTDDKDFKNVRGISIIEV